MRLLSARLRLPLVRFVAVLGALLQLGAAPVAAVAEGQFAQKTGLAQAHVEAERSSTCVAVHADACALCQLLSAVGAAPSHPAPPVPGRAAIGHASAPLALDAGIAGHGEPPSRAPPVTV